MQRAARFPAAAVSPAPCGPCSSARPLAVLPLTNSGGNDALRCHLPSSIDAAEDLVRIPSPAPSSFKELDCHRGNKPLKIRRSCAGQVRFLRGPGIAPAAITTRGVEDRERMRDTHGAQVWLKGLNYDPVSFGQFTLERRGQLNAEVVQSRIPSAWFDGAPLDAVRNHRTLAPRSSEHECFL